MAVESFISLISLFLSAVYPFGWSQFTFSLFFHLLFSWSVVWYLFIFKISISFSSFIHPFLSLSHTSSTLLFLAFCNLVLVSLRDSPCEPKEFPGCLNSLSAKSVFFFCSHPLPLPSYILSIFVFYFISLWLFSFPCQMWSA